jgi:hypothetical protein
MANISEIRKWWNDNSYSYGLSSDSKYKDVGIPDRDTDFLIAEYERKYNKHLSESIDSKNHWPDCLFRMTLLMVRKY